MSLLRITLLGRVRVHAGDQEMAGLESRKVQELLVFLLLHRRRSHPRETLAGLLWGERSATQSKKYLRQTLWQLQTAIEVVDVPPDRCLLHVEPEWIGINPEAALWLDVAEFEQAFNATHGVADALLTPVHEAHLQKAVQLYHGDLLEGWYQDWALFERECLQSMFLTMLDKLVGYAEAKQEYAPGVEYCTLALRHDPARERTHRRLMRLYYLMGNRTGALRQYETCVAMLEQELGVAPAKSTLALYEEIRQDRLTLPAPGAVLPARGNDPVPLQDVYSQLAGLHDALASLQSHLDQCLATFDRILDPSTG